MHGSQKTSLTEQVQRVVDRCLRGFRAPLPDARNDLIGGRVLRRAENDLTHVESLSGG